MVGRDFAEDGFAPDILLVDIASIRAGLFLCHDVKVFLFDTGAEQDEIIALLANHTIQGVLSSLPQLELTKGGFEAVRQGHIWMDDDTRALLEETMSKLNHVDEQEEQMIGCICEGMNNLEIAHKLRLSEHAIGLRLTSIFKKFHVAEPNKAYVSCTTDAKSLHVQIQTKALKAGQKVRGQAAPDEMNNTDRPTAHHG